MTIQLFYITFFFLSFFSVVLKMELILSVGTMATLIQILNLESKIIDIIITQAGEPGRSE